MSWSPLEFGKHRGRTLPQLMFVDPDYFFWLHSIQFLESNPYLSDESEQIYSRSRAIRIPTRGGQEMIAEYVVHPRYHKFTRLDVVPASRPAYEDRGVTFKRSVIDMEFVRQVCNYDKLGYRRFLLDMKMILFGNRSIRMTRRRCEDFFDNDANVLIPD